MVHRRDVIKTLAATGAAVFLPACLHERAGPPSSSSATVVTLDDPRYAALTRGNNPRFEAAPRAFFLCTDEAGVVDGVTAALRTPSRKITVRSGGHCYENFVCDNRGGILVDVSAMKSISREADGTYGLEAGCTIGDAYTQLYSSYGAFMPIGTCFSVGLGGHILGGGYGVWSRSYGLSTDYLHAVSLVHVDERGSVVARKYAMDDPRDREVVWAHQGGGGGNFGIVTKYWFRDLPPAPATVYQASLTWDWATLTRRHYGEIVGRFGAFFEENNGPDSPYNGIYASMGLRHRSTGPMGISALYIGEQPERLEDFIDYFHTHVAVSPTCRRSDANAGGVQASPADPSSCIDSAPWFRAVQAQAGGTGRDQRMKYKSAYMRRTFPDRQIDVLYRYLVEEPSPPSDGFTLIVGSYGGAINRRASSDTASPQRDSILKLQYLANWKDPDLDEACIRWLGAFYRDMYADAGGEPMPGEVYDGCYVNYPDVDLVHWPQLYYKDNYAALQRVKARLDPRNIFHHAQSIALP